jgi:hypothetical protein
MRAFWVCIGAMTALSIVYTLAMTYVFHLKYPYGPPLFFSDDRWFDFTVYNTRFHHFRAPDFWDKFEYPFTYPAPLAIVYAVLYRIPHALRVYLPAYGAAVVACGVLLTRELRRRGLAPGLAVAFTACVILLNYPLRTLYESANTEGIVAIIAGCGIVAILRDRCWLGGALVAIAGAMKIFPFVLLALLLSKRRYREFAWSLAVAAGTTLVSLAIVGPSIAEAQRHIDAGIQYVKYKFIFATFAAAITFNHSFFTLVKFGSVALSRRLHPLVIHNHADFLARAARERALLDVVFNVYTASAALFGIVAYFGWMRRLPLLNQVLALAACALLLPPLSADYTLLHLLLPFSLLCLYSVDRWRAGVQIPGLTACFLCFAPIFSYQNYITYRYRFSCEFRTLGLIALLWVVMRYRFPWSEVDELPDLEQVPSNDDQASSGRR